MLPAASLQRLESFVEASRFFGPTDEPSEVFILNGPLVDFAIRSTWAYASSKVVNDFFERAIAIRARYFALLSIQRPNCRGKRWDFQSKRAMPSRYLPCQHPPGNCPCPRGRIGFDPRPRQAMTGERLLWD